MEDHDYTSPMNFTIKDSEVWTMYLPDSARWAKAAINLPGNRLRWNQFRPEAIDAKSLIIDDEYSDKLPSEFPALHNFKNLISLDFNSGLIRKIQQEDIPESVRRILLRGEKKIAWPKKIYMNNISHLGAGAITFEKNNFPNLKILGIHIGSDLSRAKLLSTYPDLVNLGMTTVNTHEIIHSIASSNLQRLGISNGKIEHLDGIEKLKNLESLSISHATNLVDIRQISQLPKLKELKIDKCKKIKDFSAILSIINLQNLTITDCDSGVIKFIKTALTEKNIERLFIA